jgi:glycerol-3-phosphate acyltransferase PlsY
MILNVAIAITIGYLLGSLPSAYIAGRLVKGIDIRKVGGCNMGALNTLREVGPLPGLAVLVADIGKGALAVLIASWLGLPLLWILAAGFAAVVGHNWPVFLRFSGGKGAATTIGVMLALTPAEMGISLAIIVAVIIITSNFRLAIFIGLAVLPILIWQFAGPVSIIAYSLALLLFLGIRSLPGTRETVAASKAKKGLIFDREYHFWQTRKSR